MRERENMSTFKRERSISQSLASDSVTLANRLYLLRTFSERTYGFRQAAWHLTNSMVPLGCGLAS